MNDDHLAEWRGFQRSDALLESPFFCPEFVKIVSKVRPNILIALLERGGRTVGFFPYRRRGDLGRPIGGTADDCQAVIAAPETEWDARTLIHACGLTVYDFTHLRAAQRPFIPFHRTVSSSHAIDLSQGYDTYAREHLAARRNLLTDIAAKVRRLERQFGRLQFALHDVRPASLHILLALKNEQYRRMGLKDFSSNRWAIELLERIYGTQTEAFAGVLSTLSAGDRIIAAHMGMRSATVLHQWFPTYDYSYAKFSPGLILLLEMCRAADGNGIREIELGVGHEDYKARFANKLIPVAAGFVGSASLPLWSRQLLHNTGILASRLPVGRVAQWPSKLLRRMAQG
jgi:CelD/BcsL family acetyltransferase involved in cellulose biosynthesis